MNYKKLWKLLVFKKDRYVNLATFLESLGVVGIKLGQIMSTRFDILPAELVSAVSRLRDNVASIDYQEVVRVVEKEFGPLNNNFLSFDYVPLATASIAQVHRAQLLDGTDVVVKVLKPGVVKDIKSLIFRLEIIVRPLMLFPVFRTALEFIKQLKRSLPEEVNFKIEANSMELIGSRSSYCTVPKVHFKLSSQSVLTMEYVDGVSLSSLDIRELDTKFAKTLAYRLINTMLEQTMLQGFFHADLHQANVMIKDNDLILIDFGMTGRVAGKDRDNLALLALGFINDNEQLVTSAMLSLCDHKVVDHEDLLLEVRRLMDSYVNVPLSRVDFAYAIGDLPRILRRHGVFIKPSMLYVIKNLVTVEGVAVSIYPDIGIQEMLVDFEDKLKTAVLKSKINAGLVSLLYKFE